MTDKELATVLGQAAIEEVGHEWKPKPAGYSRGISFEFCVRRYVLHVIAGSVYLSTYPLRRGGGRKEEQIERRFELADPELLEKLVRLFRRDERDIEDKRGLRLARDLRKCH